jgi:enoyl-CoA hydratase/carnithine racemase
MAENPDRWGLRDPTNGNIGLFSHETAHSARRKTCVRTVSARLAAAHRPRHDCRNDTKAARNLGYIKRNINNAEHMSLEACFDAEAIHHSRASETADHEKAATAFVEKRKPVFHGH